MSRRLRSAGLALLPLALACTESVVPLELGGPPAVVAVVSGNNQSDVRGETLPQPLVAVVTDAVGNPSPAVRVVWSVTGGTISPSADSTGEFGQVTATWTLPSTPGFYQAFATVGGLDPAQFDAVATGPTSVVISGGNNQNGTAGTPLAQPLVVTVRDPSGRPVPDEQVVWSVTGGTITPNPDQTDQAGQSSVVWELPAQVGEYRATATVAGLTPAVFSITQARPAGFPLVFRYLDAGSYHSCGITTAEELYCWGYNADGQHGVAPSAPILFPTVVPDLERFRLVTGGRYHSCGITLSGEVACWGEPKDGRLGERPFPTTFQYAQAGYVHTCGLSLAREVWCWGYNGEGELAQNPVTLLSSPVPCLVPMVPCGSAGPPNAVRYKALTVNGLHSCAIREDDGVAVCWGFGADGQLGNGTRSTVLVPTAVVSGVAFRTDPLTAPPAPDPDFPLPPGPFIAAGFGHTCAIGMDGRAYCWGLNQDGQLGNGGTGTSLTPVLAGALTFDRITAGHRHTCALTPHPDNKAYCWGDNTFGQIGDGTQSTPGSNNNDRSVPTLVPGLQFAYIKAGELHTCGLTISGVAYCWGNNEYGQIGDGTTTNALVPMKVEFQP